MAGLKAIQFVLLISFVIPLTNALHVLLSDGKGTRNSISGFMYETGINYHVEGEMSFFDGCDINNTYTAGPDTTKVIVYIKNYQAMKTKTLRKKGGPKRLEIAQKLSEYGYELLYLGVHGYILGDRRLIAAFLLRSIEPNPYLEHFQIDTIGEKTFNLTYPLPLYDLLAYREESDIFGGNLLGELRSLDK